MNLYDAYVSQQYEEYIDRCLEERLQDYFNACHTCRLVAQKYWDPIDGYDDMGCFFMEISEILQAEIV